MFCISTSGNISYFFLYIYIYIEFVGNQETDRHSALFFYVTSVTYIYMHRK